MAIIPSEIIDDIRTRCDIVDVIGSYIQLKRAGGSAWKACCPFHNEKTPSFHVRGDKQVFHCFGCGKGGDVFRFVMEREGVSFPEAAHLLASRCSIIIPENSHGDIEGARRAANTRDRLYSLNEEFARFFETNLKRHPDWPASQYLATRALSPDAIVKFRLGAAPDEWDGCLRYGRSLGFSDEEMLVGGVIRKHEATGRLYDFFKGRLTFAIWNEQGKVVGFSARSLEAKPQSAKYVNTSETPVFKKGNLLYALPFARQAWNEKRTAILCEGQLDTIAFHRAGFAEAVAPQGTGFTGDQAHILRRHVDKVLLAFDADGAGQKAIRSALELLLPLEFEIQAIAIPGGKDPDELFKTAGAEGVAAAIADARPWIPHLAASFEGRYDLATPTGRGRAADEMVNYIMLIPNPVVRELSIREAAAVLGIGEESMNAELQRRTHAAARRYTGGGAAQSAPQPAPQPAAAPSHRTLEQAVQTLLALALDSEDAARHLADELPPDLAAAGLAGRALNTVLAAAMSGEHANAAAEVAALMTETPDETISRILIESRDYPEPVRRQMALECIAAIKELKVVRGRAEILAALRNTADPAEKMKLLTELAQIS